MDEKTIVGSVGASISGFLEEIRYGRNATAETVRAYKVDLHQFVHFLVEWHGTAMEQLDLEEIDHTAVRAFISRLAARGLEKSSRARKLSALRSFFDFLLRRGLIDSNPAKALRAPKKQDRTPAFLTRGEAITLLDEPFEDDPLSQRNRAILELLYATGIRVGELVGIDLKDIDLAGDRLRVLGKGRKERDVVFGSSAGQALEEYLALRPNLLTDAQQQALFLNHRGGRLTARSVARILKKRIREVGINTGISPHALRHTFATHMLNNGADIRSLQELLGHASLSTTQRYTRVGVEELMATYLKCHPRAKSRE